MPARKNLPEGSSQTRGPPESPWETEARLWEGRGPWPQPVQIPEPQSQRSPPSPRAPGAEVAGEPPSALRKHTAGQLDSWAVGSPRPRSVQPLAVQNPAQINIPSSPRPRISDDVATCQGGQCGCPCVSLAAKGLVCPHTSCPLTLSLLAPSSPGLSRSPAHALCHHFPTFSTGPGFAVAPSAGSSLPPSPRPVDLRNETKGIKEKGDPEPC